MVLGAKRLGYGGETTRVENRGETTRGETTRGETSWGRNVLLPQNLLAHRLRNQCGTVICQLPLCKIYKQLTKRCMFVFLISLKLPDVYRHLSHTQDTLKLDIH